MKKRRNLSFNYHQISNTHFICSSVYIYLFSCHMIIFQKVFIFAYIVYTCLPIDANEINHVGVHKLCLL